jgi:hypothetical protein
MTTAKTCVTTYLEDDLFLTLKEYSQEQKLSQSKAVEKIIRLYFLSYENPIQTINVSSQVESQVLGQVELESEMTRIGLVTQQELESVYSTLSNKIDILERSFESFLSIYSNSQVDSQVNSQVSNRVTEDTGSQVLGQVENLESQVTEDTGSQTVNDLGISKYLDISDNCSRKRSDLVIAEFNLDGSFKHYLSERSTKTCSHLAKAQTYARFDSAEKVVNKFLSLNPNRIFRIYCKYELELERKERFLNLTSQS